MQKHKCKLIPRLLLSQWENNTNLHNMIKFCQEIGADEIMLFPVSQFIPANPAITDTMLRTKAKKIAEIKKMGTEHGINVIINYFFFFGDDLTIANSKKPIFPWAVDITGKKALGYRCLLSPQTRKATVKELLAIAASSGVDSIFLDDETHYDWKPAANRNEALHFCFCPLHIQAFAERIGKKITREVLIQKLQSTRPKDVAIRKEWLAFKRDTFIHFVTHCRDTVHKQYPKVRFGQMTTFTHLTAWDGITFAEHVQAWAGNSRPLCRPAQGWYGDHIRTALPMGLAQTMWTLHCLPEDTDIYSEIDWGCPWTQLESSARMSADFQIKSNLLLNIKNHSLLYFGEGPEDEFIQARISRQIKKSRAVFDGLAQHLPVNAKRQGIQFLMTEKIGLAYPLKSRGKEGDLADPYALTGEGWGLPPWMKSFRCLARSGIPMTFEDSSIVVLTGGIASSMHNLDELLATKSLIIDGNALRDLKNMGILKKLGLDIAKPYSFERNELLTDDTFNKNAKGAMLPLARILHPERFTPVVAVNNNNITHRPLSKIVDCTMNIHGSAIHLVENRCSKTRLCALAYNLYDENAWGFGIRKQQWRHIMNWLGKTIFPVWIDDAMDVWPIVYKVDADSRLWIGLINFGHDHANDVICNVRTKGMAKVSFVNEKGALAQISKKYLNYRNGLLRISLAAEHCVKSLDTLLLIIEPQT